MPRINFSAIENAQDFTPLPDGDYRCRVSDVEETTTQRGDEMWKVTLEVITGPHRGRRIFDNLVFSDRALRRVKYVLAQLGIDVSGEVDLRPAMIKTRECVVTVVIEDYEDDTGVTKRRNRVPFTGYRAVGSSLDDEGGDNFGGRAPF